MHSVDAHILHDFFTLIGCPLCLSHMVDFGKGHKDYPVMPLAFGMAYQGLADRKAGPTVAAMP